ISRTNLQQAFPEVGTSARPFKSRKQNLSIMHITLTYFNVGGRAQATRLAFHYEGIEFEDKFVDFPAFMALKPTLPYGQVPVMEV
ncbi:unnamed protein product, partial [Choristocarpus tenellus]